MSKVIIIAFTDPMMGLSFESEPIFRKLETHYPGKIDLRYRMMGLVPDVSQFMTKKERALEAAEGISRYNKRLAGIYLDEEDIGGIPMHMKDFRLFDPSHRSSWPLDLAYKAAQKATPELADRFLYRLRYATIVETRPTTHEEEILRVADQVGIDRDSLLQYLHDGTAEKAFAYDRQVGDSLGIHELPAYVVRHKGFAMVGSSVFDYQTFVGLIDQISSGTLRPQAPDRSKGAVCTFLESHPLVSVVEIREAFDLGSDEEARDLIRPLLEGGHGSRVRAKLIQDGSFVEWQR